MPLCSRLDMTNQRFMQTTVNEVFDRSKYFDVDQMQQVLLVRIHESLKSVVDVFKFKVMKIQKSFCAMFFLLKAVRNLNL